MISRKLLYLFIVPLVTSALAGIIVEIVKPGLIKQTVENIVSDTKPVGLLKLYTYQAVNMRIEIEGQEYYINGPNYDEPTPIELIAGNHNVKCFVGSDSSVVTVYIQSCKVFNQELKVSITPPPKLGKLKICSDIGFDIALSIDDSSYGGLHTFANNNEVIYSNDLNSSDFVLKEGGHHVRISSNNKFLDTSIVIKKDEFQLLYLSSSDFMDEQPLVDTIIKEEQPQPIIVEVKSQCEINHTGTFSIINNTGMSLHLVVRSPNGYIDDRSILNGSSSSFPNYPIGKYVLSAFYTKKKKEIKLWDDMLEVTQCAEIPPRAIVIEGENPLEAEQRDREEKRQRAAEVYKESKPYIMTGLQELFKRIP